MSRPHPAPTLLALLLLLAGLLATPRPARAAPGDGPPATPARPNILFLFSDDHTRQAIGAYGGTLVPTPHLDRLAREGVLLVRHTVANSICAPSRAAILTGRHASVNGVPDNAAAFDGSQWTFPKDLRAAGYQTALFGKWHLKSEPTGFDDFAVLSARQGGGQGSYVNPVFDVPGGETLRLEGHSEAAIAGLGLRWLRERRDPDRPFLLMVQFKAPHRNWIPAEDKLALFAGETLPEPPTLFDDYAGRAPPLSRQRARIDGDLHPQRDLFLGPSVDDPVWFPAGLSDSWRAAWAAAYTAENRAYLADPPQGADRARWNLQRYLRNYLRCVSSVDDGVGALLAALDELDLAGDTLVVYSSDQGFYLGEKGLFDKRWMYEESFTAPFLARWPGRLPAGTRLGLLSQNIDVAPTLLEAAGLPAPAGLHGRSLLPALATGATPADWRTAVYYRYTESGGHGVPAHEGVSTATHKLIHYYETGDWELFDLAADPGERRSVYSDRDYGPVLAALRPELVRLRRGYGFAAPPPPRRDPPATP